MVFSQFVEGLFEETECLLTSEAELPGFDSELRGQRLEAADLLFVKQPRGLPVDIAAAARNRADDAVAFEVLKCSGNRIGINAEFPSELSDRGKQVIVVQGSGSHCLSDLGLDLKINGDAGSGMDTE
jgi:hypothetical protein